MGKYKLIPLDKVTLKAKRISAMWVDNYRPMGHDLPAKHKLASDLMNFALEEVERAIKEINEDRIHIHKMTDREIQAYLKKFYR